MEKYAANVIRRKNIVKSKYDLKSNNFREIYFDVISTG